MKKVLILLLSLLAGPTVAQNNERYNGEETNKIKVLNFGTFHMGTTSDATNTEFDEKSEKNKIAAHEIAKKLAAFKPTVIVVETTPNHDEKLQANYKAYLTNPNMEFEKPDEIELVAFELGRLSGTEIIYGIDHKMSYNYKIDQEIDNTVDSTTIENYFEAPLADIPHLNTREEGLPLLEILKRINHDKHLDFLITINADILTHVATENSFEGADEADKYYQRNLRMYTNLNRLDLKPYDRVFILMGASHTAFFRDFISRSPKYIMVNTFNYLK